MADTLKAGIIGLDTSHSQVFTEMFNDEKHAGHVPGVRVVAAHPTISPDIATSADNNKKYGGVISSKFGVKLTESIPELVKMVDVILIESVDGRRHLPELKQVADAGKPVFVDKPFTAGLADAKEMVRIIRDKKIPCFSSSALRFDANVQAFLAEREKLGKVLGCDAYSPAHLEKTNPGFFWYGIHGVEILYTIMGRGCKTVRCTSVVTNPDSAKPGGSDVAVGIWSDGRIGTMRGIREGASGFGASVMTEKAIKDVPYAADKPIYRGLLENMVKFFQTGKPPVEIEETLEIVAYIDAALKSSQEKCGDVAVDTNV